MEIYEKSKRVRPLTNDEVLQLQLGTETTLFEYLYTQRLRVRCDCRSEPVYMGVRRRNGAFHFFRYSTSMRHSSECPFNRKAKASSREQSIHFKNRVLIAYGQNKDIISYNESYRQFKQTMLALKMRRATWMVHVNSVYIAQETYKLELGGGRSFSIRDIDLIKDKRYSATSHPVVASIELVKRDQSVEVASCVLANYCRLSMCPAFSLEDLELKRISYKVTEMIESYPFNLNIYLRGAAPGLLLTHDNQTKTLTPENLRFDELDHKMRFKQVITEFRRRGVRFKDGLST